MAKTLYYEVVVPEEDDAEFCAAMQEQMLCYQKVSEETED